MKIISRPAMTAVVCAFLAVAAVAQPGMNYDALVQQGKTQLQSGNNDAALASANAAIKLDANRWEAFAVAGGALMNLKRYEDATDDFSKAIERAPEAKRIGLRDLRKQCLSVEVGGTPAPNSATKPEAAPGSSPAPSYAETVKWIQEHIQRAGFPQTNVDTRSGLVFKYEDAAYTVRVDGCTMNLSLSEHWHTTDTKPSNPTDQTDTDERMNITFHLLLDKISVDQKPLVLLPQGWELRDIDESYRNKAIPTVTIVLPDIDAGTTTYDWSSTDETVTPKSQSWSNRPIMKGDLVSTINSVFGGQIPHQGIQISYARPGTEDEPDHMAKALQHLADLCRHNPGAAPKDIF